jgi:hypothetical protein
LVTCSLSSMAAPSVTAMYALLATANLILPLSCVLTTQKNLQFFKNVSVHGGSRSRTSYIYTCHLCVTCRASMSTRQWPMVLRTELGKQVGGRTTGSAKPGARAGLESMVWLLVHEVMRPI